MRGQERKGGRSAARGGVKSKGYKYSGSDDLYEVAWCDGKGGYASHPVKEKNGKKPNELGIYGMSGNVWEWCQDCYVDRYSGHAQTNPTGPLSGSDRVCRGGCWGSGAGRCRVAYRNHHNPNYRDGSLGFRLVLQ